MHRKKNFMKRTIRVFSLVVAICMCWSITAPVFAASAQPGYDSILQELGISEEMYWAMPAEKRTLYQDWVEITASVSDTKYFKGVSTTDLDGTTTQILVEITEAEYIDRNAEIQPIANPSSITTYWCSLTTTIKKGETVNGLVRYYVINNLEVDSDNMGIIVLDRSAFTGISIGSNMSPVSGSEVLSLDFTYLTGGTGQGREYIMDAQHRSSGGYAFDFVLDNSKRNYKITMAFQVVPNTNAGVTVVDAYGFAGYWGKTLEPSISVGADGVGIAVTPANYVSMTTNTHAQLFV